jgi:hypothetical protein
MGLFGRVGGLKEAARRNSAHVNDLQVSTFPYESISGNCNFPAPFKKKAQKTPPLVDT